jgi:ketosteroid isomerase-like protein
MSQENVEMVRLLYTPLEEGGYQDIRFEEGPERVIAEVLDPEFKLISLLTTSTGGRSYRGHEGVRAYARDMEDAWEYFLSEIKELHDAGDQVVAIVHVQARGRVSGAAVDLYAAHLWTFRDGKAMRMHVYADAADALEAVGLGE